MKVDCLIALRENRAMAEKAGLIGCVGVNAIKPQNVGNTWYLKMTHLKVESLSESNVASIDPNNAWSFEATLSS